MSDITVIINLFSIIFAGLTCIFSIFALYYSIKAWTASESLRLSTHTVQYEPVDKEIDQANQNWSTKQENNLASEQKAFSEDIENEMPEFASDDEDKEVFSF